MTPDAFEGIIAVSEKGGCGVLLREKLVIIINGRGGSGKDAVCAAAAGKYAVRNVSSIDPVKEIARTCGWHGEKDEKARRFLSDLKQALIAYNDLPNAYLAGQYREFLAGPEEIMFVHIRERDQIEAFRRQTAGKCVVLLVVSPRTETVSYGNGADDGADGCGSDYVYRNDRPLDAMPEDFLAFLDALLRREGVL